MAAYSDVSYSRVPRGDARFDDDDLDDDYFAPPVRRDRYSRRPSQGRRTRDVAVTWLSASSGTQNTSRLSAQPNFSQPNLSNFSQPNLSQTNLHAPTTDTMISSTPQTRHTMPQPHLYYPPPPQPIDMPTPVIGRPKTPATPAIGEHMAVPSEFEEEDEAMSMSMPYVPHRQPPPRNRFVGGFIKTLKMLPRFGRWRPNRQLPPGAWKVPSSIPEIHLEEEPDSAYENEPPESQPTPGIRPEFDLQPMPEPEREPTPVPSVLSPRIPGSDRADRARMPEPAVPYPVTQVYSGNISSVGTPTIPSGAIPIERSPPDRRHAPTPAVLRHALSMDDDIDDQRSLEDDRSHMSFVMPPRTSTPVDHHHRHRYRHPSPRPLTPVHTSRPSHPQPPSEASFGPVIPPHIHVTSPTHSSPSHTHSPPHTHTHTHAHAHPHAHADPYSQFYGPSSRMQTPQNSTFQSHITRFKRFVQELDQLPFSSDAQIAEEYIPSQTKRSRVREEMRGTTIPPSWYDMYDQDHHYHHRRRHHSHGLGANVGISSVIPGYGAVPTLDSMPPPLHKPTWGESWDQWAAQRVGNIDGPTHQAPLLPGGPGGAPGVAEMNTRLGLPFPHGYAPAGGQPAFVYPSMAGHPLVVPGMW